MKCMEIQEKIPEYLDENLSGQGLESFENHIAGCDKCRRELELHRKSWQALEMWDDLEPSADFLPEFWKKAESKSMWDTIAGLFRFPVPAWAMVLLLAAGIYTGQLTAPAKVAQAPPQIVYVEVLPDYIASAEYSGSEGFGSILPEPDQILNIQAESASTDMVPEGDFEIYQPFERIDPLEVFEKST